MSRDLGTTLPACQGKITFRAADRQPKNRPSSAGCRKVLARAGRASSRPWSFQYTVCLVTKRTCDSPLDKSVSLMNQSVSLQSIPLDRHRLQQLMHVVHQNTRRCLKTCTHSKTVTLTAHLGSSQETHGERLTSPGLEDLFVCLCEEHKLQFVHDVFQANNYSVLPRELFRTSRKTLTNTQSAFILIPVTSATADNTWVVSI